MTQKNAKHAVIAGLLALMLALLFLTPGCKKETAPPTAKSAADKPAAATSQTAAAKSVAEAATQTAEQTICPVMGKAIDKSIFTEYRDQKVYFCCQECLDTFKADPEKYVDKLPQFKN